MEDKLENIVIVGSDLHAWSVATGLLLGLKGQDIKITVVGLTKASLPNVISLDISAHQFHRKLGIQEPKLVANIGGAYSYGWRYKGFGESAADFIYTHSPTGEMIDRVDFHQYLNCYKLLGAEAKHIDHNHYSIAGLAAGNNTFTHPQPGTILDRLDYNMQVDGLRYLHLLRSSALEYGAQHIEASLESVSRNSENGQVDTLELSNGVTLACDFLFDCDGYLSNTDDYRSCSDVIPTNRKLAWVRESKAETPVIGTCTKFDHAYLRTSALPGGGSYNFFYNDHVLDDSAALEFANENFGRIQAELSKPSDCAAKIHKQPWATNTLAIGRAAGHLGDLLFSQLFHTHNATTRWLALYPTVKVSPLLADEYNRQMQMEYQHVRDVHSLLLTSDSSKTPATLAHRLDVFRKTGRVAFYESDVLEKHQWVNLFIGCGVWPERADPLLNHLSKSELAALLLALAKQSAEVAAKFPKHDQLLKAIRQSA